MLAAKLATQSETIGSTATARKYAKAMANQNFQLRKLRQHMIRQGCSSDSVLVIGGDNQDQCDELEGVMSRMKANLAILNEKRTQLVNGATSRLARQRLMTAYQSNGCSDQQYEEAADEELPTARSIEPIARLAMNTTGERVVELGDSSGSGGLRTVCVRLCDGGFFPISSHASPLSFQRDAKVCSMMCPGTKTELYYQPLQSDATERMVSVQTGQRYGSLPAAFAFRESQPKSKNPSCGCNIQAYYEEMLRREAMITKKPVAQPGKSVPQAVQPSAVSDDKPALAATGERSYNPQAKVRIIVPGLLPDANGAINLGKPSG